jgi:phage FluMu gp28-like protein
MSQRDDPFADTSGTDDGDSDSLGLSKSESKSEIVTQNDEILVPKKKGIITSATDDDVKESADRPYKKSVCDDDSKGTPGWVNRDPEPEEMDDLLEFMASEVGLVYGLLEQDELDKFVPPGETWSWEWYQLDYLDVYTNYISNKARQTGLSTAFAAKAFARGILVDGRNYTAIFTSYKKEEAINKIKYVKQFLSALPPRFHKKIIRDPMQLIEWENYNGTISKIVSHAQRPIRGINGDIFLDELAFYQFADEIYESALPATAITKSTLDITSTPFGKSGKFYEIVTQLDNYPDFERRWIHWWNCKRYLKEPTEEFLAYAEANAPDMNTEERVHRFGNDSLLKQYYQANDEESFRQEFEGFFVDAQASFFSRELILNAMYPTSVSNLDDYNFERRDFSIPIEEALSERDWPIVERYEDATFKSYDSLEDLYSAVQRGEVSRNLIGGADIGTTRHSTEFVVLEEVRLPNGGTLQVERFNMRRNGWSLPAQQAYFNRVLQDGFVRKMRMDCTGVGMQIGQYLSANWEDQFEALQMGGSNSKQEREMTNLRARLENYGLALAYEKDKVTDLHSIKRVITPSKNTSYRAADKKLHHADYAWAIAFASLAGTPFGEEPIDFGNRTFEELKVKGAGKDNRVVDDDFVKDFNQHHVNPGGGGGIDSFSGMDMGTIEKQRVKNIDNPGKFVKDFDTW